MSIRQTIMILGFFLIIQPFLGFSSTVDIILNIVVGLLIIILAYKIFPTGIRDLSSSEVSKESIKYNSSKSLEKKDDLPFVEHNNSDNTNSNSVSLKNE
jgi:hypothetical protein